MSHREKNQLKHKAAAKKIQNATVAAISNAPNPPPPLQPFDTGLMGAKKVPFKKNFVSLTKTAPLPMVDLHAASAAFALIDVVREGHANSITQIVPAFGATTGNIVATVASNAASNAPFKACQINVYDNEHFGTHFDLVSHFRLPQSQSPADCISAFAWAAPSADDLIGCVGTTGGSIVFWSMARSQVLAVCRLGTAAICKIISFFGSAKVHCTDGGGANFLVDCQTFDVVKGADCLPAETNVGSSSDLWKLEIAPDAASVTLVVSNEESGKDSSLFCVTHKKLAGKRITSAAVMQQANTLLVGTADGCIFRFRATV